MVIKIIKSHCKIIFCMSYSETFLAVMLRVFLSRDHLCLSLVSVAASDHRASNRAAELALDHLASAISFGIGYTSLTPFVL